MATIRELWDNKDPEATSIKVTTNDLKSTKVWVEIIGIGKKHAIGFDDQGNASTPLPDVQGWSIYTPQKPKQKKVVYSILYSLSGVIYQTAIRVETEEQALAYTKDQRVDFVKLIDPQEVEV